MSTPQDPHPGSDRSDALAHTFPPLPREGGPAVVAQPERPPVSLADLPDKAFLERQRQSMARDAFWGRVVFVLAIFALLIANTLAQRAHTRELLQNIDWARQHQSGLEDDVEMRLARIEAKLLSIEQRLPPPPQPSEVAKVGEPAARATPVANPPEPAAAPVQP